jgi:periplasmic protein TonB
VPAQLLKSVPPVYPPDAMRNFITGDVRLDALVDAKGRVKTAEVLVGPSQLHQAAIDAIKKYEYAPATKGTRSVDSHVIVTIKFWYNP